MPARKMNGKWFVDFRIERRRRWKAIDQSRAGAEAWERDLRRRAALGEDIDLYRHGHPKKLLTFAEFSKEWFETYVKANCRPSDQQSKRSILDAHLLPRFGTLPLVEITKRKIEIFKSEQRQAGLRNQTINNHLNVLSGCLHCAEDWEVLDRAPRVKRLPPPAATSRFLTLDEVRRIVVGATFTAEEDMVLLALGTGLRIGELRGLDWLDIDFEHAVLTVCRAQVRAMTVDPKGGRSRQVPVPQIVLDRLRNRRRDSGPVFRGVRSLRVSYQAALDGLRRLCRRSGVRPVGWHTLRHTYATQLATRVPERAVQELLGHADIKTTQRYTHFLPSSIRDASSVINDFLVANEKFGQPVGSVPVAADLAVGHAHHAAS